MEIDHTLEQLANVPFGADVLKSLLRNTKVPNKKLSYLEKQGKIIRLKRGMYLVAPAVSRKSVSIPLVANHWYGPSYVSCHSPLRYWGLIPECVYITRSVTLKRARSFVNQIGQFDYYHAGEDYYPIGIQCVTIDERTCLMASPEKALCDLIVTTPYLNLRYKQELLQFLEEDLRLDMEEFSKMNVSIFKLCANVSKKQVMIKNIVKLLQ